MTTSIHWQIDRNSKASLAGQITGTIRSAIRDGRLTTGSRLPSWQDLASQLGVARGTIRTAYEQLIDEQLLVPCGPAGTHVAETLPPEPSADERPTIDLKPSQEFYRPARPDLFQMGVPAEDAFPAKLWSRIYRRAVEMDSMRTRAQDPRGNDDLRRQIAAHLAIARGIRCSPGQVFISSSFRAALSLILMTLQPARRVAWVEEPGFPITRFGLELAGYQTVSVGVDEEGIKVGQGVALARDAALAIVTPGQQAPLGYTLSSARRRALLDWAASSGAWIIEDDYLSELQLEGRAALALAGQDEAGRVIHIGTFSKTISPSLGIGFVVVPEALAQRTIEVAAWLMPPPNQASQLALAEFLRDGHYLRHLRKMKQLYAKRRSALVSALDGYDGLVRPAALAVHLSLPSGVDDVALLERLRPQGMSPTALSHWYRSAPAEAGLILGITNVKPEVAREATARLRQTITDRPAMEAMG